MPRTKVHLTDHDYTFSLFNTLSLPKTNTQQREQLQYTVNTSTINLSPRTDRQVKNKNKKRNNN